MVIDVRVYTYRRQSMAIIGYGRVSSTGQSLDVQEDKLKAAGATELFMEKRSGTTKDGRTELEAALRFARRGDVLIVTKLDRLARSMTDMMNIVADLDKREIGFKVLDNDAIDTTTASGRMVLGIMAVIAEFETALRKERQADGIAKAKTKGIYKGRPPKLPKDRVRELDEQGLGATAIAKELGISRASVYRLLKDASQSL